MPAVGLDISDASMRFVELLETHKGFVVGRFGEHPIPTGVIESGEIKKTSELRAVFAEMKKQYGIEYVSVSLPEEKAYLFDMKLPAMKYKEVRSSIELSLEEHIPLRADEVLFDYEILKEAENALYVSVSAVPRSLIDSYLEAFSGSGLTPVVLEIETQSVARAVVPHGDKSSYLIVDFGNLRTGITIVSDETVQFTSTVPVGGWILTELVAKNLKISHEEAEKLKREKGMLASDQEQAKAAMIASVGTLREEISRELTYWSTHEDEYGKKHTPISKIYLCGGDSNLIGLVEYLASELHMQVELANVFVNVHTLDSYVPAISFDDSLRYAPAIGLALRQKE